MKPTGPVLVFFKTFFILLMVMCGLIGILTLLWFIHRTCQRRSNAAAQESLPMPEMNNVKPVEATNAENEALPQVVIIDTSEGGNPATEIASPTNPKVKRRKLRLHKADPRGGIWMKAEFVSQGETSSTAQTLTTECDMSQLSDLPVVDEADDLDPPAVEEEEEASESVPADVEAQATDAEKPTESIGDPKIPDKESEESAEMFNANEVVEEAEDKTITEGGTIETENLDMVDGDDAVAGVSTTDSVEQNDGEPNGEDPCQVKSSGSVEMKVELVKRNEVDSRFETSPTECGMSQMPGSPAKKKAIEAEPVVVIPDASEDLVHTVLETEL